MSISRLPAGPARELALRVNGTEGRADDSLRTKAELSALFDLLLAEVDTTHAPDAQLTLAEAGGAPTAAGEAVAQLLAATIDKPGFFHRDMYLIHVTGWPPDQLQPEEPVTAPAGAHLALWGTDPRDPLHIPAPTDEGVLFATPAFSLMNSGNRTLRVPKRSWKIEVEPVDDGDTLVGMRRFNLKAMYNDPSQMREALAWRLFGSVGVPASEHTYAKLAFDHRYFGLFSFIEQVDKRFLRDHFGKNDRGNLYKAYCGEIGCATLQHRTGADGDDSGRQYIGSPNQPDQTYRLKTNEDDPQVNTYDDLAQFVRVINGVGLPGGDERFESDDFRESVEGILNVRAFLRWAGVNALLGSWDNYFATPANYYLYNSGFDGDAKGFMERPYFTFIPWDYDNSLGIDYFGTQWQFADILDWPSSTRGYWAKNGHPGGTSRIPLVQNVLRNRDFREYYLDHIEHLLETDFTPDTIDGHMRGDRPDALWTRASQAAYLESDTPWGAPFTGRQFPNHEVYLAAAQQYELRRGEGHIEGIVHFVRMRHDSVRRQLDQHRSGASRDASGPSGARFIGVMESVPAVP